MSKAFLVKIEALIQQRAYEQALREIQQFEPRFSYRAQVMMRAAVVSALQTIRTLGELADPRVRSFLHETAVNNIRRLQRELNQDLDI